MRGPGTPTLDQLGVFLTVVIRPPLQVILDYYGVAFLLLVPLLFAARPVLAVVCVAVVALMPAAVHELVERIDPTDIPAIVQPFAHWLVFGTYPMAIWLAFPLAYLVHYNIADLDADDIAIKVGDDEFWSCFPALLAGTSLVGVLIVAVGKVRASRATGGP